MTHSLVTAIRLERADETAIVVIADINTTTTASQVQDLELVIAASSTHTITGVTAIKELTVIPHDDHQINVIITEGLSTYTVKSTKLVMFRGVAFTSVTLSNPGVATIMVKVVVAG